MHGWRIYYDDGSTFSSEEGSPEAAPAFGVVAILQPGEPGDPHAPLRQIMHRWDWYYWHEPQGRWWGCDVSGLHDRLLHRLPVRAVCQGRTVPSLRYREIMRQAGDDDLARG